MREVSVKDGMPTVKEALEILELEIKRAKRLGLPCIKVIHGYGSKGIGGKIRTKVRSVLHEKKTCGEIKDYVLGEEWSIFNDKTREILSLVSYARNDKDLEKLNLGVTIIVF